MVFIRKYNSVLHFVLFNFIGDYDVCAVSFFFSVKEYQKKNVGQRIRYQFVYRAEKYDLLYTIHIRNPFQSCIPTLCKYNELPLCFLSISMDATSMLYWNIIKSESREIFWKKHCIVYWFNLAQKCSETKALKQKSETNLGKQKYFSNSSE